MVTPINPNRFYTPPDPAKGAQRGTFNPPQAPIPIQESEQSTETYKKERGKKDGSGKEEQQGEQKKRQPKALASSMEATRRQVMKDLENLEKAKQQKRAKEKEEKKKKQQEMGQ